MHTKDFTRVYMHIYIYNMYVHSAVLMKTKLYGSPQLLDLKNGFTAMHKGKRICKKKEIPLFHCSTSNGPKKKKKRQNDEKQYETTMTAKKALAPVF